MGLQANIKILRIWLIYVATMMILVYMQSGIFFATSHGKSPCDGVGGTVKRLVDRAIKQDQIENPINTPKLMYEYCYENIKNINFLFRNI